MPQQPSPASKPRNAIAGFISDTVAEMKKVTWLTRREVAYLTLLVLVVAIVAGLVLGLVDLGFTELIRLIPRLGGG
jgi:preprotein translocase subunit SecE